MKHFHMHGTESTLSTRLRPTARGLRVLKVFSRPDFYLLRVLRSSAIKVHLVEMQFPTPSIFNQICSGTPFDLFNQQTPEHKAQ